MTAMSVHLCGLVADACDIEFVQDNCKTHGISKTDQVPREAAKSTSKKVRRTKQPDPCRWATSPCPTRGKDQAPVLKRRHSEGRVGNDDSLYSALKTSRSWHLLNEASLPPPVPPRTVPLYSASSSSSATDSSTDLSDDGMFHAKLDQVDRL